MILQSRLNNLQALRAIAAYLVLFAHIEDIEAKYGQGRILGPWIDFGVWGVDLFFVLSGFVMVLVSQRTLGSMKDAGKFVWSRATRIYPLWWLCLSALVLIWMFRPHLVYGGAQQEIDLLKDYLLIPKTVSPLLETGWTLIHEMYFYAVFALILLFPLGQQKRLPLILGWGVVAVALGFILSPQQHEAPLLRLATHPMTLEFVAGAAAAYIWRRTGGAFGPQALAAGAAAFLIGFIAYLYGAFDFTGGGLFTVDRMRVILCLPSAALLTYGAASVELREGWQAKGLPVHLGDWSYSLYLTHMLSANAFGLTLGWVAVPGIADNVIGIIAGVIGCTAVAWACFVLFERPVINTTRAIGKRLFR